MKLKSIVLDSPSKASAINTFRSMEADYIGYVDDDVIFEKNAIYNEIVLLNSSENIWGVFVDSFPLPCKNDASWSEKIIYNSLTLRTRFGLLAKRYNLLIGRCVLIRKKKFPKIPEHIINEDQFLDYVLYPHVCKINNSIVYYEGVYSIRENFRRDLRITAGRRQLKKELPLSVTRRVDGGRSKSINYRKLFNLPFYNLLLFIVYKITYRLSKILVGFFLIANSDKILWKRTN